MKPGLAKGSALAARTGRFSAAADARRKAAEQAARREETPLPTEPPAWLTPVARSIWREYLPQLVDRATAADAETFAGWCSATAEVRRLVRSRTKTAAEHLRASQRVALAYARELGLTVVSRARIPAREHVEEADVTEAKLASRLA